MKGVSTVEFLIIVSLVLIIAAVIVFIIKNQNYEGVSGLENLSSKEIENISVIVYPLELKKGIGDSLCPQKQFIF